MSIDNQVLVDKKSFAAQLLHLQEKSGFSQSEIARRSEKKFSQPNFFLWVTAESAPNVLMLPAIAKAVDCEPWELLEDPSEAAVKRWESYNRMLKAKRKKRAED